jgi:hypothetical protein
LLVAADSRQQRAAAGRLEQRCVEEGVERPEQAMPLQAPRGDGPDCVELVRELEPVPVVETEAVDSELLPFGLVGRLCGGEPVRGGDRQRQALAPRQVRCDREHGGRVASPGEADETRGALERRKDRPLERGERRRRCYVDCVRDLRLDSEDEPRGDLDRPER